MVDLGSDFRLDTARQRYEEAYGSPHPLPSQLGQWRYGLPELFDLSGADRVASPGCYPTATLLAIAPLLKEGVIEPTGIVADCLSGVSGAGRSLKEELLFGEVAEGVRAYGVTTHRHRPEIEMALDNYADTTTVVTFTPHLVPIQRGLLATVTARLAATDVAAVRSAEGRIRQEPVRRRDRSSAADPVGGRVEPGPGGRLRGSASGCRDRPMRHRQPLEGCGRTGRPGRQHHVRARRDDRPADRRVDAMSVTAARGFLAAGTAAGIKALGRTRPGDRHRRRRSGSCCRCLHPQPGRRRSGDPLAVNVSRRAWPGRWFSTRAQPTPVPEPDGMTDAEQVTGRVAELVGDDPELILMCSTGPIGSRLPVGQMLDALPGLVGFGQQRRRSQLPPKQSSPPTPGPRRLWSRARDSWSEAWRRDPGCFDRTWQRCFACSPPTPPSTRRHLSRALAEAVPVTFNSLNVDGCESTNDTVLLLASGKAAPASADEFGHAVESACRKLAYEMAADAEGASRVVKLRMTGASDHESARRYGRVDRRLGIGQVVLLRRRSQLGPHPGRAGDLPGRSVRRLDRVRRDPGRRSGLGLSLRRPEARQAADG